MYIYILKLLLGEIADFLFIMNLENSKNNLNSDRTLFREVYLKQSFF